MLQGLGHSKGPSSYATAEDHRSIHDTADDVILVPWRASPGPADASSASHSETPSFREREAELQTIQGRFGEMLSRRKLPASFQSRFREDFSEPGPSERQHSSFLSKIYTKHARSALKSPKYTHFFGNWSVGSLGDTKDGKIRDSFEPKRYSSATIRSSHDLRHDIGSSRRDIPTEMEGTMTWWEKAVKLDSKAREPSSIRDKQPADSYQGSSLLEHDGKNLTLSPDLGRTKTIAQPASGHAQPRRKTTPRIQEPQISGPLHKLTRKNSMPPQSWAKYPSHLFEERNGLASAKDEVNTQDFSVHAIVSDGELWESTDKPLGIDNETDHTKPLLSEKLGKALKTGFSKLVPLVDLRRITTERSNTAVYPSNPKDSVTDSRHDETKRCTVGFDGSDERILEMVANNRPVSCSQSGRVSDITIDHMGAPSTGEYASGCHKQETTILKPAVTHIFDMAARMPPESKPHVLGLRPAMSDCPLHASRRAPNAAGNTNWPRSFTCVGPAHLRGDMVMELEKWQRPGRLQKGST